MHIKTHNNNKLAMHHYMNTCLEQVKMLRFKKAKIYGLHIVHPDKQPVKNKENTSTVKTLYNVTRYNRIFNIRNKIAGNGFVSIKIPSL